MLIAANYYFQSFSWHTTYNQTMQSKAVINCVTLIVLSIQANLAFSFKTQFTERSLCKLWQTYKYWNKLMSDLFKMNIPTALPRCRGRCNDVDDDVNIPPFNLGALSISFSGCGFLGIYHMGVASALRQYIPGKYLNFNSILFWIAKDTTSCSPLRSRLQHHTRYYRKGFE